MIALFLFAVASLGAATPPRIAIIGGPQPLWPEILAEFQHRYPALDAQWDLSPGTGSGEYDLISAYYPTSEQMAGASSIAAKHYLGFPVDFVARTWKAVDGEAGTHAAAYLDEGGVENGVRLLLYLYTLVDKTAPAPEPPVGAGLP